MFGSVPVAKVSVGGAEGAQRKIERQALRSRPLSRDGY
jgi:hypothetical protein